MPPDDTDSARARILALDQQWKEAAARRDLEGMMAIYAPNAHELLPGMPPIVGREAIGEFYGGLIARYPRFSHEFEAQEVIVAESGDLAVVRGSFEFTADTRRPEEVATGKFVGVWRFLDGDWRLQMNISNADDE